jgi:hypothetical protein
LRRQRKSDLLNFSWSSPVVGDLVEVAPVFSLQWQVLSSFFSLVRVKPMFLVGFGLTAKINLALQAPSVSNRENMTPINAVER